MTRSVIEPAPQNSITSCSREKKGKRGFDQLCCKTFESLCPTKTIIIINIIIIVHQRIIIIIIKIIIIIIIIIGCTC